MHFEKLYSLTNNQEKHRIIESLINKIEIHKNKKENGQWLKAIYFNIPLIKEDLNYGLDNLNTVETAALLSHKAPDSHINVKVEFGEGKGKVLFDKITERAEKYKPKERVTYKKIKEYIEDKFGFKVHTAYIAEVKRAYGLPMYDASNAVEELK